MNWTVASAYTKRLERFDSTSLAVEFEFSKNYLSLKNYFEATIELMKVLARACGYNHLNKFGSSDLTTFDHDMYKMAGIPYGGINL